MELSIADMTQLWSETISVVRWVKDQKCTLTKDKKYQQVRPNKKLIYIDVFIIYKFCYVGENK